MVHRLNETMTNGNELVLFSTPTTTRAAINSSQQIFIIELIETNVYQTNCIGNTHTIRTRSIEILQRNNLLDSINDSYI